MLTAKYSSADGRELRSCRRSASESWKGREDRREKEKGEEVKLIGRVLAFRM
jgi:hypothetical protein